MENFVGVFIDTIEHFEKRAGKYCGIHAQYGNANAFRTCNVLLAYCRVVRLALACFFNSFDQYISGISLINSNDIKSTLNEEYEKAAFRFDKKFNETKKSVLFFLKSVQDITGFSCDNKPEVETLCVEFSDFIDEIIEDLGLENEQQMED